VDGKDVVAVYEVAKEAVDRARNGEGPSLIEIKVYRLRGHFEGDAQIYRSKEDLEKAMNNDPVKYLEKQLLDRNLVSEEELQNLQKAIMAEIDEIIEYARQSEYPEEHEALENVFIGGE